MMDGPLSIERRTFVHGIAALGVCLLPDATVGRAAWTGVAPSGTGSWDDPASWSSGTVPGPGDIAVVDRPVVLGRDVELAGVRITASGVLTFDPAAQVRLQSRGNIVVEGALVLRPSGPAVVHRVSFVGVDETRYVGGHTPVPTDSDVGLWVVGDGVLDAVGAPKQAWTRATIALEAGQVRVPVEDVTGWQVGDRVAITPTGPPSLDTGAFTQDVEHATAYDVGTILAIDGLTVTLRAPLAHAHPTVTLSRWDGTSRTHGAEVLNLSRNVVLEGQPTGRAHVQFLHSGRPQQMAHVEVRHMGPRQGRRNRTKGVRGRYGLHFHMCGDGSRGSVLDGVVVHSGGTQAFVPHDSHGITMRRCVAHDVKAGGFWWDLAERGSDYSPQTHDSLWEECVASRITTEDKGEAYRMAGFLLAEGQHDSNRCIGCVAVGVTDKKSRMNNSAVSGFHWSESGKAMWVFQDCLAHNNGGSGSLAWQNDENIHVVERLTTYHNGRYGIEHGAYANNWQIRDCACHADRVAGVGIHAVTRRTNATPQDAPLLSFQRIVVDGAGRTTFGFTSQKHTVQARPGVPVLIEDCTVAGTRTAALTLVDMPQLEEYHVRACRFADRAFLLGSYISRPTMILCEDLDGSGTIFTLHRRDQPGTLVVDWNARRRS